MSMLRNAHVALSNLGSRAPRVSKRGVGNSGTVTYIIYSFGVVFYIFLQLAGNVNNYTSNMFLWRYILQSKIHLERNALID